MPPRLSMHAIRKRFGATLALNGVSLSVAPGEVHALVGQNGAGKSTLMKILSGATRPDEGEMSLDGERYAPASPLEGRKLGVAMIYQELSLAPHLSVAENIVLGLEPTRVGLLRWREMKETASRALATLGHADLDVTRPVAGLSPATQQVIEIARALAVGCRVLVLDEPTSSLTRRDVQALFEVIRRLKQQNVAIVYISHFLEEVREICDRFTILRDGKTVGAGDAPTTPPEKMVELMVGRSVDNLYPRSSRSPGDVVLEINNLSGATKPHNASLTLRRGQVLGIAGLIGAGRTEFLRALFGLDPIREGKIKIATSAGRDLTLTSTTPATLWRSCVGVLSEDRKSEGLALSMSIADNATLTDLKPLGRFGFISPRRQRNSATRWADALSLKRRDITQPVADLSGGNQQKVALARLLHHDCDILLLDEPTRGIDVASKAQIYQLIDQLAAGAAPAPPPFPSPGTPGEGRVRALPEQPDRFTSSNNRPKSILIISSYFPELLGICDQIAVMTKGHLSAPKSASEWTEHALVLACTGPRAPETSA
ncbi:MAG TPA: sugar ABC transporter ATP-binding protein [Tepidisphaeraceae bacterium]